MNISFSYNLQANLRFFFIFFFVFFSNWSDIEKISSVDKLGQLENSLKESLNQIQTHKVCT